MMFWGGEMNAYQNHGFDFANDSSVNGTNYYNIMIGGFEWSGVDLMAGKGALPEDRLSLDDTLGIYKKLENPNYTSPVTAAAFMMVVLIVLHNLWLIFSLHRARAWVIAATASGEGLEGGFKKHVGGCLHPKNPRSVFGTMFEKVFRLSAPEDVQIRAAAVNGKYVDVKQLLRVP